MNPSRPLDNFPLIRTRKLEEVRETLERVYAKPTVEAGSRVRIINATLNICKLQHVGLGYTGYGADLHFGFPATNFFLHLLPIRGNGEIITAKTAVALNADTGATISPNMGYEANYCADYEFLILRIDALALTKKLETLTGATIKETLRMEGQANFMRPAAKLLRQHLLLLVDTLSAAKSKTPLPAWGIAQTEQLLMTLFLCANQHNYSHLLEREAPEAAPRQVRQAEEYIEANWQQAITLEDLAEVTGVSTFSLFRSFKKSRGYSPLAFVSQVRARRGWTH